MTDVVSLWQNLTQVLCTQNIPECCLSKKTSGTVCILNIGDGDGGIVNPEVDNSIDCYCHTVSCQNLERKMSSLKASVFTWWCKIQVELRNERDILRFFNLRNIINRVRLKFFLPEGQKPLSVLAIMGLINILKNIFDISSR